MGGSDEWGGPPEGPSAEELLRQEYPDLMDLWTEYQKKEARYMAVRTELENFTIMERMLKSQSYIHVFNEWLKLREEYWDAEEEYKFLEKLLRDY